MNNKKILVVDDEPDIVDILEFSLEHDGYKTYSAFNIIDAFEIITNEKIDLVISDVRMPNGSGLELAKMISEIEGHKPKIIFASGFSDYPHVELYNAGAEAIFTKPYPYDVLSEKIKEIFLIEAKNNLIK